MCDEAESRAVTMMELDSDEENIEKFSVSQFTLSGSDDDEAIILTGVKTIPLGVKNLNTPSVKFIGEYEYADELKRVTEHVCDELLRYLDGKVAPSAQLDLFEE
jgi:hypothetical protein